MRPGGEEFLEAIAQFRPASDISLGGLRFVAPVGLEPGMRLLVHIALQDPVQTIRQNAEVRWVRLCGNGQAEVGLVFLECLPLEARIWEAYVASLAAAS